METIPENVCGYGNDKTPHQNKTKHEGREGVILALILGVSVHCIGPPDRQNCHGSQTGVGPGALENRWRLCWRKLINWR